MPRVVLGLSGASGAAIGLRVAEILAQGGIETHLVVSAAAERTLAHEIGPGALARLQALVHVRYPIDDIGAAIASGSFRTAGMIVAPCSMRVVGAIASIAASDLLIRAADVTLKERRRLVLVARESPLHLGHLRAMAAVTEAGAIVAPPVPAFYLKPTSVAAIVDHIAHRAVDLLDLPDLPRAAEWTGEEETTGRRP
ncbi:UbiX family flavin prenyltransferase [Pinisolibacter sp.]|uniref:UbiX family flavin prenyltransferase n=1 Tax=Pinisolibacter sp. TaxID=2172024 RepID=UPI002FDCC657